MARILVQNLNQIVGSLFTTCLLEKLRYGMHAIYFGCMCEVLVALLPYLFCCSYHVRQQCLLCDDKYAYKR